MTYLTLTLPLWATRPYDKTIDASGNIVKLHGGIGIDTTRKVQRTMHQGHDSTHHPEPYISLIFEPQI